MWYTGVPAVLKGLKKNYINFIYYKYMYEYMFTQPHTIIIILIIHVYISQKNVYIHIVINNNKGVYIQNTLH